MTRLALSLVLVVIAGCAADVIDFASLPMSDERRGLAGHRFEAESLHVDGQDVDLGERLGHNIRLEIGFGLDHIYVFDTCNQFTSGPWEVVEGQLMTGPAWNSTSRACGAAVDVHGRWLIKFLSSSPFISRDGDTVVLSDGSTVITLRDTAGLNRPDRIF